ncbi:hypothetical protein [Limnoglobus roseus]|uniref:TIGR03067 domain-containing protein n=1 Tax=Limnoglobus roseus TaxID=2598579 RepID=A0A5C1AM60_9BACT|nr:hypothetical protein [Limnoglobus roseus]QEL19253.1 hypothetical protein PX52LOC_06315 [Limnoglobus roseus]
MVRALVVLLAACPVHAAPIPKGGDAKLYSPTTVGAKWVYDRGDNGDEAFEVSTVEKKDGEWVVSRQRSDGAAIAYLSVAVSAAGLTQPRPTSGECGPTCLLKPTAKAGDSWDVPGGKRTLVGTEKVTVGAGTYTALVVSWVASADGARIVQWYAPGVGEVKKVMTAADGTETVMRSLKSFTPGPGEKTGEPKKEK